MAQLVIRQFDVVQNPDDRTRTQVPYLIVLQSHLLYDLETVIVAPLMTPATVPPDGVIALGVAVQGQSLTLNTALLANIQAKRLGRKIESLDGDSDAIRRALERLFTGF